MMFPSLTSTSEKELGHLEAVSNLRQLGTRLERGDGVEGEGRIGEFKDGPNEGGRRPRGGWKASKIP